MKKKSGQGFFHNIPPRSVFFPPKRFLSLLLLDKVGHLWLHVLPVVGQPVDEGSGRPLVVVGSVRLGAQGQVALRLKRKNANAIRKRNKIRFYTPSRIQICQNWLQNTLLGNTGQEA